MSDSRLFSSTLLKSDSELTLGPEQSRYIRNVLRLRNGDSLVVFDGTGYEFASTICGMERQAVTVLIGSARCRDLESKVTIHLVQGVSRGERMDMVVQKATELGVRRISPVMTRYSVVKLDTDRSARRADHWQRIARSACEQCGRNIVPQIDTPLTLDEYLQTDANTASLRLYLHAGANNPKSLPVDTRKIEFVIGPEGGLHEDEISRLQACGYAAVSMGPRILRTETAAITAMAIAQHRWGDIWGGRRDSE